MTGKAIRVRRKRALRDIHGPVHAGSFLRERTILVNCASREFSRVFVHEVFHFAWLRLGNGRRHSYEDLLRREWSERARGELGWSAEWRKRALSPRDSESRSRRWREYCCESFCDTAAWLYSGVRRHKEFTLAVRFRNRRRAWFGLVSERGPFSI
ncbi:MAG: hypothetical protein C5B51_16935 [Terriglobia bacterium]|nr:MAG: hypothetical protein C5B51_16935 [Terriglobia bacterium]